METQGLVTLEAMLLGKPVIFSQWPRPETIEPYKNGLLYDIRSQWHRWENALDDWTSSRSEKQWVTLVGACTLTKYDLDRILDQNIFYKSLQQWFAIITHVVHYQEDGKYYAYALTNVNEMNLWGKCVDEVLIVAPKTTKMMPILIAYQQNTYTMRLTPTFRFISIYQAWLRLWLYCPSFYKICYVCKSRPHSYTLSWNTGLLGCLAQMFFPKNQNG